MTEKSQLRISDVWQQLDWPSHPTSAQTHTRTRESRKRDRRRQRLEDPGEGTRKPRRRRRSKDQPLQRSIRRTKGARSQRNFQRSCCCITAETDQMCRHFSRTFSHIRIHSLPTLLLLLLLLLLLPLPLAHGLWLLTSRKNVKYVFRVSAFTPHFDTRFYLCHTGHFGRTSGMRSRTFSLCGFSHGCGVVIIAAYTQTHTNADNGQRPVVPNPPKIDYFRCKFRAAIAVRWAFLTDSLTILTPLFCTCKCSGWNTEGKAP